MLLWSFHANHAFDYAEIVLEIFINTIAKPHVKKLTDDCRYGWNNLLGFKFLIFMWCVLYYDILYSFKHNHKKNYYCLAWITLAGR